MSKHRQAQKGKGTKPPAKATATSAPSCPKSRGGFEQGPLSREEVKRVKPKAPF